MSTSVVEQEESDFAWVLDSLVGFLKGPIWNLPLLSFIEQKSVDEADANEEEYGKIFAEYKNLVDRLLGSHMDDLAITGEQFEETCRDAEGTLSTKFHQQIFEQVYAANDYDIFKRMMVQTNIDLQLQALEILAQRYGVIPESFLPAGTSKEDYLKNEDTFLEAVIKRSLEEQETEKKLLEVSVLIEKQLSLKEPDAVQEVELDPIQNFSSGPSRPPTSALRRDSKGDVKPNLSDIKARQIYLRKQRDQLVATKKKERQKQMTKVGDSDMMVKRPKSSKTLMSVVQEIKGASPDQETIDKGVAFRKSLAARLKKEVHEKDQK